MKVLVYHPRAVDYGRLIGERFPDLDVAAGEGKEILYQHIADAEVMIVFRFPLEALESAKKLRWIQVTSVGVEDLLAARKALGDVIVTNARGIHSEVIADYTFGVIVMLHWNFRRLLRHQEERRWDQKFTEPLAGKTLGVVGLGAIGREIARRGPSLGMSVVGIRRNPQPVEGVSRICGPEQLMETLSICDFVVLVVPATPETQRMIGQAELCAMKRTAYLINIARGSVVDEPALVRALREGWIAGAALDVFEKEPLPVESPLWGMENVIITPHIAGNPDDYVRRVMEIFAANVVRWKAKMPLLNRVDLSKGY